MADMGRDYEERPFRDVIADMLAAWQGDDAGVYAMADQLANKLRSEGYIIREAQECKVCGEDIDPFCIKHGYDGTGIASFFREAVKEGYAPVGELLAAVGGIYNGKSSGDLGLWRFHMTDEQHAEARKQWEAS